MINEEVFLFILVDIFSVCADVAWGQDTAIFCESLC